MTFARNATIALIAPLLLLLWWVDRSQLPQIDVDVCVYGGTSAGVAAAVAAARSGKKVLLIEPSMHIGGMSASGLGMTDYGDKATIGGIAREFYRRVGQRYGKAEAWTFEPNVAESVFNDLVRENGVILRSWLRLSEVDKKANRINRIIVEGSGERLAIRASVFIDATYEGDLMAKAGVTYVVGREGKDAYGESLAGVRPYSAKHQFQSKVDPFIRPGDEYSGLIPLIEGGKRGWPEVGSGDKGLPAYNFRLCLTKRPANRIAIDKPEGYTAWTYELLARTIGVMQLSGKRVKLSDFLDIKLLPNDKADVNNNGPISTDYIGANSAYPDGDEATRERIYKAHESYTRGLLYFLGNDPRVPRNVREEMKQWGLPRDEFRDNGGWPYALYVREARRMVGEYVITQTDCDHMYQAVDSVALGSYSIDSHHVRRFVNNDRVVNEGDIQIRRKNPYPLSYGAITPREAECANLLVPVCLSGTHIAFSSIRMEPVFMMLGQAAGTAAAAAIDEQKPVQKIDRSRLQERLRADGQIVN